MCLSLLSPVRLAPGVCLCVCVCRYTGVDVVCTYIIGVIHFACMLIIMIFDCHSGPDDMIKNDCHM